MTAMTTMSSTTNTTSTNWWKGWQMAVLVGTPIAIGSAIYLYRRRRNAVKPPKSDSNSTLKIQSKEDKDKLNNPLKIAVNHKVEGNKLFQKEQYLKAIECYTSAISECPTDNAQHLSTFYQNRAASYEMLKKYDEVIADCDKAIQLDQRYVKALLRRAKAYEALGNTSGALNDITAVCILEQFQNSNNLMMTDRILKEQSKLKAKSLFKNRAPKMPSRHFVHHYIISYSKDPIFKNIESTEVPNIEEMLGTYEQKQAESGDAIIPEYLLLKGTVDILKGNIESAEAELEKLLQLSDCDNDIKVNALIKLGTIKVQDIGKNDSINDALKHFEEAIKLDADNPDIYLHRAQIYLLSEKVEEARKDLETCCSLDDRFASALAQKLYVQFRCAARFNDSKSIDKTVSDFEKSIEKFPNSSEVYSLYAQSLLELLDFEKADKYFAKAIEIDPMDGNLYVHRGILYLQWNEKVDKAVDLFEKAKQIDPNCQFAFEMLGSIEVQKGNLLKGISYFDQALESAQTELDCAHLYSLRDAAEAQLYAIKLLGITLPQ